MAVRTCMPGGSFFGGDFTLHFLHSTGIVHAASKMLTHGRNDSCFVAPSPVDCQNGGGATSGRGASSYGRSRTLGHNLFQIQSLHHVFCSAIRTIYSRHAGCFITFRQRKSRLPRNKDASNERIFNRTVIADRPFRHDFIESERRKA